MRATPIAAVGAALIALAGAATFASADVGGPSVTLSSTASPTTDLSSIPVTVAFSESVNGFGSGNIDATNAGISSFAGSGANYTFDLNPGTQGAVSVTIPADTTTSTASSTGNQASNTLNFTYDTSAGTSTSATSSAPVISNVAATNIDPTDATISWTTDATASSQVIYGTSLYYGASTSEGDLGGVTSHSQTLYGLTPSTMYDFYVMSSDGGGTATSTNMTFTTTSNASTSPATSTEPVISDINVSNIGTSTAMVTWTTDLATSGGMVNYGADASYGSTAMETGTSTMSHSVMLSNLSEAALYHFDIQSATASSTNTSSDNTFMTESTASTTPLAVDGVTTVQGSATPDGTFADGWLWTMHLTVPSVEDAFRMAFSDFTSTGSSSTIPAANDIMIYSPESSNASTSASAITETDNGYSSWMYLNGDTATSTAGRQIDVYIGVAVPLGTAAGTYSTNFSAQSTPSSATSTTI